MVRWFMSRHGEEVLALSPGLLARLAQGGAEVALVFSGDSARALVAWKASAPSQAEILACWAVGSAVPDPGGYVFGPDGPLAAAGVRLAWALEDSSGMADYLVKAGFSPMAVSGQPDQPRLELDLGAR
jgi:hypothetical protein